MALNKVDVVFRNFRNLKKYLRNEINVSKNPFSICCINKASHKKIDPDGPIKYSSVLSSSGTGDKSFGVKPKLGILPIEKYVFLTSLICLLCYFIFFRKKNQIDDLFDGIYESGNDEIRLRNALLYSKLKGLKTDEIEEQLRQIVGNK